MHMLVTFMGCPFRTELNPEPGQHAEAVVLRDIQLVMLILAEPCNELSPQVLLAFQMLLLAARHIQP